MNALATAQINRFSTEPSNPSQLIATEIRAELARQGRSQRWLSDRLNHNQSWVSTRISPSAKVNLTFEEVAEIAEALGVSAQRFLVAWLPRLDSNQQPSGYLSALVRALLGRSKAGLELVQGDLELAA